MMKSKGPRIEPCMEDTAVGGIQEERQVLSHMTCYLAGVRVHVLCINTAGLKVFILSKTKLQDLASTSVDINIVSMLSCVTVVGHFGTIVEMSLPKERSVRAYSLNCLGLRTEMSVPKCLGAEVSGHFGTVAEVSRSELSWL